MAAVGFGDEHRILDIEANLRPPTNSFHPSGIEKVASARPHERTRQIGHAMSDS
jgi:hypothetical protein